MYSFHYNVQFVEVSPCLMEGGIANSVFNGYIFACLVLCGSCCLYVVVSHRPIYPLLVSTVIPHGD